MRDRRLIPGTSVRPLSVALIVTMMLAAMPYRAEAVWHQQQLPGLVSGKSIALLAIVGGGAVAALFILGHHKAANRVALDIQVPRFDQGGTQPQEQVVGITNRTRDPVSIKELAVEPGTSAFSIAPSGLPLTVAPGERVTIPVRYTSSGRERSGDLRIVLASARTKTDVVRIVRLAAR